MSASENNNITTTCANCGKGEEAAGDLKACTACKMVKYCNRDCQIAHRPQHKKACKKRAAELHDEKLFKQPPTKEDCPICMLPLPYLETGQTYQSCCGKTICSGCLYAVAVRDCGLGLCPFCRTPAPNSVKMIEQIKKLVGLDDVEAIRNLGGCYFDGMYGVPQNQAKALELWHRAGELGNATSYYNIGNAYMNITGSDVERDTKKANHYFELAALGGHVYARHNLGGDEYHSGNHDRALKHFMLAAGGGSGKSLSAIQAILKMGKATKEDYKQALRAYQAYLGEIKSAQRDEAAAFHDRYKYY